MRTCALLGLALACFILDPAARAAPTPSTLSGRFEVVWGDPEPRAGLGVAPAMAYSLNRDGVSWPLAIPPDVLRAAGGATRLNGRIVVVESPEALAPRRALPVASLRLLNPEDAALGERGALLTGSQPFIWILLRFKDVADTPHAAAWYTTQATGPWPSLDNYYREVSFNNINIVGSGNVGWFNLPENRSHYVHDIDPADPGDELERDELLDDAIALANPSVDFRNYVGIILCLNADLDGASWGGMRERTVDGVTKTFGIMWMADWGWGRQRTVAHEMGHSLGLPHSSGPYGETYDSEWDVMSKSGGTQLISDPTYGVVGQGMNAYDKDKLAWIPDARRYVATVTPFVSRVTLHDLNETAPAGTRQIIRLPKFVTDSSVYYTVEKRCFTGYDRNIPDETVVIHDVDTTRGNDAQVIDPDGDGDCNDDGARWEPGETFTDAANKILVTVESESTDSAVVVFSNAGRNTVYVDDAASGAEDGTSVDPWNSAFEGTGSVYPDGTVYLKPGTYDNETMTLVKPMLLRGWGAGNVVIGD